MKEYKVLLIEERDVGKSYLSRALWEYSHVILQKEDGSCEVIKDRFSYPSNSSRAVISFPLNKDIASL